MSTVGILKYGPSGGQLDIEDRVLAHLQTVIVAKLRLGESFAFTWQMDGGADHEHVIWVHPALFLEFVFTESHTRSLNRAWLETLLITASGAHGLVLVQEPEDVDEAQ
jgi:hypothetical protein